MTDRVKKLLHAQIGKRSGGWLFPSPRYAGQPIKRHALTAAWRMKATKAGVSPDVDPLLCEAHVRHGHHERDEGSLPDDAIDGTHGVVNHRTLPAPQHGAYRRVDGRSKRFTS
jgi:hypothetical protein